ncbi:hypothetical protein PCC9214_03141 [Planktothrix tepida]|uniref:DUF4332 domain-containing protein n=2 Tax=Planktothrix TaxID=54304 RepID=A0A1J1LQJ4_9CYAN|nr:MULTISPECIES: DUF4332 domain-containing protein [Planktothrix]CAD5950012.1 hypothetical protein NO713_02497 [Planktothrix pseudagardhii]CAD5960269.1 hypothetical protein PCC9214_03141 [Planktothrix tepida]CUR34695.1 conserved hypothetical protein [Planktothrix tepida PCC 9214]
MTSFKPNAHNLIQAVDWPISQLPGLNSDNQTRLNNYGIKTTCQLLKKGKTPADKMLLANFLQINIRDVNKWIAMADLARIPSVGCQYCGLLLHSGVSSVSHLAKLPVHRLHQQILRFYVANLQRRDLCPSVDQIQQWVQQAKFL